MASFSTCWPLENRVLKTRFKAHIYQNSTSQKRNQSQKEKKKKRRRRSRAPGLRDLGRGHAAWVARPRSRARDPGARSLSLPLWSDYFSLSYLVSLSLIWLSLWSDPIRWGEVVLGTWEIFKMFLNYKSSL